MKKIVAILVSFIFIISLGALVTWTLLPTLLSHTFSKTIGASMTISKIQLMQNGLKISGIKINNPPEYSKTPHALSINTLTINSLFSHLFNKKIVIDTVTIDSAYVGIEFASPTLQKGNWTTLIHSIKNSKKKSFDRKKKKGFGSSILIKRLIIDTLQVELAYQIGTQSNKKLHPIHQIELTNMSSEEGIPTADLINLVIERIIERMLQKVLKEEGFQKMLEEVLSPKEPAKDPVSFLKFKKTGFQSRKI